MYQSSTQQTDYFTHRPSELVLCIFLALLTIIAVGLRILARIRSRISLALDDWFVIAALFLFLSIVGAGFWDIYKGGWGQDPTTLPLPQIEATLKVSCLHQLDHVFPCLMYICRSSTPLLSWQYQSSLAQSSAYYAFFVVFLWRKPSDVGLRSWAFHVWCGLYLRSSWQHWSADRSLPAGSYQVLASALTFHCLWLYPRLSTVYRTWSLFLCPRVLFGVFSYPYVRKFCSVSFSCLEACKLSDTAKCVIPAPPALLIFFQCRSYKCHSNSVCLAFPDIRQ